MKYYRIFILVSVSIFIFSVTGCSLVLDKEDQEVQDIIAETKEETSETQSTEKTEAIETTESITVLYEQYLSALASGVFTLPDHIRWLDTYMSLLSPDQASKVLIAFEKVHWDDSFLRMEKLYVEGSSEPVKSVADAALSLGYKLEPVEGSLNIIIDYGFYEAYLPYVTEDVAAFYRMMKVESDDVPLKDAAVVIEWVSLFERAAAWEAFTEAYPNSDLFDSGKDKYLSYVDWSFNGAPNTPVFDWDQKVLTDSYREGIETFLATNPNGAFSDALRSFYDLVKANDYVQNTEIEKIQSKYLRVY